MKLRIAKTFRLGGKLWRQDLVPLLKDEDGVRQNGLMCYDDRRVEIDASVDEVLQASTQVHEWLEAINDHYGVELKHEQIEKLEQGLYEILTTRRGKQ